VSFQVLLSCLSGSTNEQRRFLLSSTAKNLQPPCKKEDEENHEDQAQSATGVIPPAGAVRPSREAAQDRQEEHNDQNNHQWVLSHITPLTRLPRFCKRTIGFRLPGNNPAKGVIGNLNSCSDPTQRSPRRFPSPSRSGYAGRITMTFLPYVSSVSRANTRLIRFAL
jgi:hypothetical protein